MTAFVDTNALVYARDSSEPDKRPLAAAWMARISRNDSGCTSIQVLDKYDVTVTRKRSPGLQPAISRDDIRDLTASAHASARCPAVLRGIRSGIRESLCTDRSLDTCRMEVTVDR